MSTHIYLALAYTHAQTSLATLSRRFPHDRGDSGGCDGCAESAGGGSARAGGDIIELPLLLLAPPLLLPADPPAEPPVASGGGLPLSAMSKRVGLLAPQGRALVVAPDAADAAQG